MQTLLLAVEVPPVHRPVIASQRRLYQEVGVAQYWIVDSQARSVEVWTPGDTFPTTEETRLTWRPTGAADAFVLELAEVFKPV
jgi:Uma2 family endonuclease